MYASRLCGGQSVTSVTVSLSFVKPSFGIGGDMADSRRQVLKTLASAAAAIATGSILLSAQMRPLPQPRPSPNAPDPNVPSGLDGPQPTKETKVIPPVNVKEIREEVDKMYELTSELKKQLETTDVSAMLSISVVDKAKQIEKLAKRVKDQAKG
jgi:hypothetical protein